MPPTPRPSPPSSTPSRRRSKTALAPVRGRPYIVFHDAFHYFEDAFDIPATGSVVLQEGVEPSAARVAALRDRVATSGIDCAFTEPQFEPRLLHTLVEGTDARIGEIDDIGAALPPGPDLYPSLLRGIADRPPRLPLGRVTPPPAPPTSVGGAAGG